MPLIKSFRFRRSPFQTLALRRTTPPSTPVTQAEQGRAQPRIPSLSRNRNPAVRRTLVREPPVRRGFHFKEFAHSSQPAPCALLNVDELIFAHGDRSTGTAASSLAKPEL